MSLKLHIGNWRDGSEEKELFKTEPWTKEKGRQEWDCKENPRNTHTKSDQCDAEKYEFSNLYFEPKETP